jgi:hypothetical protein
MFEAAALAAIYLAFALLHAAAPSRHPAGRRRACRLAALACGAAGVGLWALAEGPTAALLVGLAALSVFATLIVLLAPVAPRLVWGAALACAPAALALGIAGACRGC